MFAPPTIHNLELYQIWCSHIKLHLIITNIESKILNIAVKNEEHQFSLKGQFTPKIHIF